jgi:ketosteroid isomerase-like protein
MAEDFHDSFLARYVTAHAPFVDGDPEPWLKLWSRREPVSLFDGFGYISKGWGEVEASMRKASARMSGATSHSSDLLLADVRGDLAYTVAIERSTTSADGTPPRDYELRVTQIYRLEDGLWTVVHRHGDIIQPRYPDAAPVPGGRSPSSREQTAGSPELGEAFFARMIAACEEFASGRPDDWIAMWSHRDPVSVFGGFGYGATGWDQVEAAIRTASARCRDGRDFHHDQQVKVISGDLAYTAAIETYTVSADGNPAAQTQLRVTQIYRRDNRAWRVAHRHGDHAQPPRAANFPSH